VAMPSVTLSHHASGHHQGQWCCGRGQLPPPPPKKNKKLGLLENCENKFLMLENYPPKMQSLGLKIPILGKFRGKIEILSTHNFFCWN